MTVEPLKVVIVDDHAMFRAGVRHEIADLSYQDPDGATRPIEIVGEAKDVASAVATINENPCQVVLLDVHLPGGGGIEVIKQCRSDFSEPRFLALSVSDAAEDVIGVIRAGARGYITKSIGSEELVDAIGRVASGDAVFSPRLAGFVLDAFSNALEIPSVDEELDRLSTREVEVMKLIARGYAYKEVAKELFISIKTVESHVSSVLRKLQLSNRHQLTKWASERNLV